MDKEMELLYQLWLNINCGHDPVKISRILKRYGSAEAVFHTNFYDPEFCRLMKMENVLQMDRTLEKAKRLQDYCESKKIQMISISDDAYPERLRHIADPPHLLYALGDLPDLNRLIGVAVVGTRHCSDEGRMIAKQLGRELAESGIVVISGMALGIDGAAHAGALEAGGITIALLAGGVDLIYPTEHTELYKHIQTHGAVLSERPPGMRGRAPFYKQRNRIMVGLSYGVLAVEGRNKSGTSLTIKLAHESNRDVFAVPSKPTELLSELPNALIADGAKLVTSGLDVVEEYIGVYPEMLDYGMHLKGKPVVGNLLPEAKRKKPVPVFVQQSQVEETASKSAAPVKDRNIFAAFLEKNDFNENEKKVLWYLWEQEKKVSFDAIADCCGLPAGTLSGLLIILQMKRMVSQSVGNMYCLQPDCLLSSGTINCE